MPNLYAIDSVNGIGHIPNSPGAGFAQKINIDNKDILVDCLSIRIMNNGQNPGTVIASIRNCSKSGVPGPKTYVETKQFVDVPVGDSIDATKIVAFEFPVGWKPPKTGEYWVCFTEAGDGGTHTVYGSWDLSGLTGAVKARENNRWALHDGMGLASSAHYVIIPKKKRAGSTETNG